MKHLILPRRFRAFGRNEDGMAAVEFSLFFPVFLFLFFWTAEIGLIMLKSVILEHSLDITMRELRLGNLEDVSAEGIKNSICERALLISDCRANMMIELQPVSTQTWVIPETPVRCVARDEELQPVVEFRLGRQNEIMLVRACTILDTLFPGVAFASFLNTDDGGGVGIASVSAFVNEPT